MNLTLEVDLAAVEQTGPLYTELPDLLAEAGRMAAEPGTLDGDITDSKGIRVGSFTVD